MQTAEDILAFSDRFLTALEKGDTETARACYAPDAKLWHNTDGIEQTVDENMKVLDWFVRKLTGRRYRIVRREALADGWMQQHVLEAVLPDGRLASGSHDLTIQLCDPRSGAARRLPSPQREGRRPLFELSTTSGEPAMPTPLRVRSRWGAK